MPAAMTTRNGLLRGLRGAARVRLLQMHRLLQFEDAFNRYLAGTVSADQVRERARKMLEIGLPPFAGPSGRRKE